MTGPSHGVMQPPSVFPEWLERTAHLVLGASADPAPAGEGQPVTGAEAEYNCAAEQQAAGQTETDSH